MQSKQTLEYISLTHAAQGTPYSQEYLSLRARQGKLKAVKQGRAWVTTRAWVDEYIEQSSWDQKKEAYNAGGQKISPVVQNNPASGGKNMCVPQPPKRLFSFWARIGAACTLCTRVILSQAVLERVLVGSLIGILAVTALLGVVGFSQGQKPPSSGPFAHIITGMEVVWHKADEIIDEWGRSRDRVIARGLIEQQEQSKVAGVKIYADDEDTDTSWTHTLTDGMNTVIENIINAVRLDE